jgi:hypothetical protein
MDGLIITGMAGLAGKLVYDIAGPAAKELGEMLKDKLRPYRALQQRRLAEKTARMLQEAEIQPKTVHPKLLLTIFDCAGIEDDDDLHTMWAALLANAAVGSDERELSPAFPEVLRQLSSRDANVLKKLFDVATKEANPSGYLGTTAEVHNHFPELTDLQLFDGLENLIHHSLIEADSVVIAVNPASGDPGDYERQYRISPFGQRFIHACEAPTKK